ncbi:MAG: hypothetical protein KAH84_00695 [Thiomargarita sp.]|nr:hypothetical protein [Thiomargarita sp.]
MKNLANLYNPHSQTKQELIDNFVVRQKLFKKLFQKNRTIGSGLCLI